MYSRYGFKSLSTAYSEITCSAYAGAFLCLDMVMMDAQDQLTVEGYVGEADRWTLECNLSKQYD